MDRTSTREIRNSIDSVAVGLLFHRIMWPAFLYHFASTQLFNDCFLPTLRAMSQTIGNTWYPKQRRRIAVNDINHDIIGDEKEIV